MSMDDEDAVPVRRKADLKLPRSLQMSEGDYYGRVEAQNRHSEYPPIHPRPRPASPRQTPHITHVVVTAGGGRIAFYTFLSAHTPFPPPNHQNP